MTTTPPRKQQRSGGGETPLTPTSAPRHHREEKKKMKTKWSDDENLALMQGIERHGTGAWIKIKDDPDFALRLAERTSMDLKDRFRNIKKRAELDFGGDISASLQSSSSSSPARGRAVQPTGRSHATTTTTTARGKPIGNRYVDLEGSDGFRDEMDAPIARGGKRSRQGETSYDVRAIPVAKRGKSTTTTTTSSSSSTTAANKKMPLSMTTQHVQQHGGREELNDRARAELAKLSGQPLEEAHHLFSEGPRLMLLFESHPSKNFVIAEVSRDVTFETVLRDIARELKLDTRGRGVRLIREADGWPMDLKRTIGSQLKVFTRLKVFTYDLAEEEEEEDD